MLINDGIESTYTSIGERVGSYRFNSRKLKKIDIEAAYDSSWIVKKFIDKTTEDMLKRSREFSGEIDDSRKKEIEAAEETLGLHGDQGIYHNALKFASLYGESLIVAITDADDSLIGTQLDLSKENIVRFLVFHLFEITPSKERVTSLSSRDFGSSLYYEIKIGKNKFNFHHSRCHRTHLGLKGLNDRKRGSPDIQAPYDVIKVFEVAVTSTGETIEEANVDVIFVPGLNNQINAGQEENVIKYASIMKKAKSATGILLIDGGEQGNQTNYVQKNAQFSGLGEVITKLAIVLAGALDRPLTVFFGESAKGFSSGEEENKSYYNTILALQESRLRPIQNFTDQFIMDKLANNTEKIEFTYPSIADVNEMDKASKFTQYSTGFSGLVSAGIVTESVAIREMIAKGVLNTVTEEDVQEIEESNTRYGNDY